MAGEKRTIQELVYFYPDARATGPYGVLGEAYRLDLTHGDRLKRTAHQDTLTLLVNEHEGRKRNSQVTIAKGWLWRTDVTFEEEIKVKK